ncbi:SRPBCC family protein [Gordonia sp. (in: high G+C Gram-positive bacteria)]|uniref:SRPBCC family protein n=1 Tax=Gordonia sp. (in: high G+C Gram-positive bacteria) TaxID=84139 RepID=UPI0016A58603|nr:SRPBCC family protein [Gordonia sp. (in: high G+C Gram-positive bacteria)]NLG46711.1 SRPBCC family protein [Gordonia sp. (in: high G+C Gram-positive bacteria)]
MGEVQHEAVINSAREKVFAYVDDYRNVPDYMFGVGRFTPTTDVDHGLGSEFETAIKVGPKELTSTVRCTEWAEGEVIKLESVKGFGADSEWRFADGDQPGTTLLTVRFGYTLPGGLTGKVLGGLIGPFAEQGVKHTENKIRAALEA